MTSPQYINDLASLYTRMHTHPGVKRPLAENFGPSLSTGPSVAHGKDNREVEEDDEPDWKRLIRSGLKKQKRHMAPTIADVPRDNIPDAEESEENQNVLHKAQEYLESVINVIPIAVGGVNIHSEIKKAFIAGTRAN